MPATQYIELDPLPAAGQQSRPPLPYVELDPLPAPAPQITANTPQITANPPEITANPPPAPGPAPAPGNRPSPPGGFPGDWEGSIGGGAAGLEPVSSLFQPAGPPQPTVSTLPTAPDAALQALQTPPPAPVIPPMPSFTDPTAFTDPMSGVVIPPLPMTAPVLGDRDLEGQRALAMRDPVSLGERLALNASDAFYGGTLAGSNLLAELQQAARMTPQEWASYNTAVRYAGGSLKPLPRPEAAQAELARLAAQHTRYETIPGAEGPLEMGAAIAGQLAGGLPSPETGINKVPGVGQALGAAARAAPVIPRVVERVVGEGGRAVAGRTLESGLSQGVVNTAVDPLAQVGMIQTGMQEGYDPARTALAFPAGVAIGAGLHGATEAAGAAARRLIPPPELRIPQALTPGEQRLTGRIAREQQAPFAGGSSLGTAERVMVPPPRIGPGDFPENQRTRLETEQTGGPATGELVQPGDYRQETVPGTPRTGPAPEVSAPPEAAPPGPSSEPAAARPAAEPVPAAEPRPTEPGLAGEPVPGTPRPAAAAPVTGAEAPAVAPEPRPTTAPEAPSVLTTEPRITTEPDHLDPNRSVAKNEAGEVIGKGATPEEAMANARERGGEVYPPEERPAAAPAAPETPTKRPVTQAEYEELGRRYDRARAEFARNQHDARKTPEQIEALRQKAEAARVEYENAQGPPVKPSYIGERYDPNLTREQRNAIAQQRRDREAAAQAEHDAAIERRIHAEGTDPTPEPNKAGQVFSMGGARDQQVVRGTDTKGNTWVGNGYALVKGAPLERAATAAEKRTTTTTRQLDPGSVDRVLKRDPKVTYEPVTWERQVTDTDGKVLVIGTRADGSHVVLQKPIYDALHAAAGKEGVLVSGKGDDRVWAAVDYRSPLSGRGDTGRRDYVGVGMPINVRQEQARAWARGEASGLIEGGQPVRRQRRRSDTAIAEDAAPLADEVTGQKPAEVSRNLFGEPLEEPGTGPRTTEPADWTSTGNISEDVSGAAPVEARAPTEREVQLQKQTATRDRLQAKTNKTLEDEATLERLNRQIPRLERRIAADQVAEERRAGVAQPVTGAPRPRDPGFYDYKFNNGVSVYTTVFDAAGIDRNLATSRPVEWQNRVLSKHMETTLGFRSVDSAGGTPTQDYVRRNAMLDTTRAASDLMASLGLPLDEASLNGRLKLTYDPEGSVSRFGAYDLRAREIRLTGRANSFGHEWIHAVDHMLAEELLGSKFTQNLISRYARQDALDPKDGLQGAIAKLLNAVFYDKAAQALREIDYLNKSKAVDAQGNPTVGAQNAMRALEALEQGNLKLRIQPSAFRAAAQGMPNARYFTDPAELLARSGEAYLSRQMKNHGADPRGAVMPDEAYAKETERLLKELYPKGEDQARIFDAWKTVFDEMTKANVLGQGRPGAAFPNLGVADPRHYPPSMMNRPGAQTTVQQNRRWSQKVNGILQEQLFDPSRPRGPLTWGQQVADLGRGMTWSDGGLMQVLVDRAPDAAKPFLQELRDLSVNDPASGRYTPEFLQERSRFLADDFMRRFTRIIQNGGYAHPTKMPEEHNLMIRHILTTGDDTAFPPDPLKPNETKPIPANIKQIAGNLRGLLDEAWNLAHDTGLEVGYAKSGYFPRQYDKRLIFDNPDGFRTQAAKVYDVIFDRELGQPGDDPQALWEKWSSLSKAYKAGADPQVEPAMRDLRRNLREQREIQENPAPTPAETARLGQLQAEAQQIAIDNHDLIRSHISGKEADSWWMRIANPGLHDFDHEVFSARHFSERTLPPEADLLMRDYMVTSVNDAIPHYFESVSRRVADAERFGVNGERADELLTKALNAGLHPDDLADFKTSLQRVRGVSEVDRSSKFARASSYAHAYGSTVLMDRSAWSSLAEPINAGLVTGYHSLGPRIIWNQFVQGFGQLFKTANARERADATELLGVIHSAQTDSIVANRQGNDYANTPRLAKFMNGFYRLTGLTQLTNNQRIATVAGVHWFMTKLAKSYLNQADGFGARFGRDRATRWFNEMGVPEELHGEYAQWLADRNGRMPTSAELLNDDMAGVYGLAMRRVTNRIIQNPFKVERAAHADTPGVGLAFQLMAFPYAYQKNVIEPMFKSIHHSYAFGKEDALNQGWSTPAALARGLSAAGGTTVNMAAAASAVVGAQLITSAMREAIFSSDKWAEHQEKGDTASWLLNLAMQRSGLNGTLDPIIQVVTNLKYFTDIQSLIGGGSVAWIGKNMTDLVMGIFGERGETNARVYQGWRGALNLGGVPLAAYLLNAVGTMHPALRAVAGAALQYGTSSQNVSHLTERIAGPKGAKPMDAGSGKIEKLGGLDKLSGLTKLGAEPEADEKGGGLGGGFVPWALMDDFIAPATRVAGPIAAALPGPIKIGAALAAGAYGLVSGYNAGAPYRGQPPPERKAAP